MLCNVFPEMASCRVCFYNAAVMLANHEQKENEERHVYITEDSLREIFNINLCGETVSSHSLGQVLRFVMRGWGLST